MEEKVVDLQKKKADAAKHFIERSDENQAEIDAILDETLAKVNREKIKVKNGIKEDNSREILLEMFRKVGEKEKEFDDEFGIDMKKIREQEYEEDKDTIEKLKRKTKNGTVWDFGKGVYAYIPDSGSMRKH